MRWFVIMLIFMLPLFTHMVRADSVIQVESKDALVDATFTINITCVPSEPIKAWEFKVRFDPSIIQVVSVLEGDFFHNYMTFGVMGIVDNNAGTIINAYDLIMGQGNITSPGIFMSIDFKAIAEGDTTVSLYDVGITNETQYLVNIVNDGFVAVRSQEPPAPVVPNSNEPKLDKNSNDPPSDINPITAWILSMKEVIVTCTIFICLFLYIWSRVLG